jgi:RNA polymerase sigma-70 factor (ECF subfamily)
MKGGTPSMEREPSEVAADEQDPPQHAVDTLSLEQATPQSVSPARPEALWERFHQELRAFLAKRVAGKADVDDLLQAIYLRIHTTLSRPIELVHPRGWIFQVARSVLIDHLRAARAKDAQMSQVAEESPSESELSVLGEDDEEAEATLISCLKPVLETLPEPYRQALVWTELHNMSQREAASRAGLSIAGMKSRVQRGRAHLKDALLACCDVQLDRRRHPIACERKSPAADSTESSSSGCARPGTEPSCT